MIVTQQPSLRNADPAKWASRRNVPSAREPSVRRIPVTLHIAIVAAVIGVGFWLFQVPFRHFEILCVVWLSHAVGIGGVQEPMQSYALIVPHGHPEFWVEITPTCSSLASVLSFVALSTFISKRARRNVSPVRFWASVAVGASVLFVGNLLRIAFSAWVGTAAGSVSLVLFHDWVGSAFGFASLLAGWVLLLWLILPKGEHAAVRIVHPARAVRVQRDAAGGSAAGGSSPAPGASQEKEGAQ